MPRIHDLLWKEPLRSHVSDTYEFVVGEYQALTSDATLGGYRQTSESSLSILYQPLLASSQTALEPASITSDHPHLPLEERLRLLKRLHEQGLIADEEYRSKKQQILDQL
jgi:putative oligomerization/nucleic acid binding protein